MKYPNKMNLELKAALQSVEKRVFSSEPPQFDSSSTSNNPNTSSEELELYMLQLNNMLEQPAAPPNSAPSIHGGDSVRGSEPSCRILGNVNTHGASTELVPPATNGLMTVMGWGNYQHINMGNDLNPSGQLPMITGSNTNLIPMTQPLTAPHSVAPVTDVHVSLHARRVVENISEAPIMVNMPASGANSQLKNVRRPQFPQNMNTGCAPFHHLQRFNQPMNTGVSQQHFAVAPVSSGVDPAGTQLLSAVFHNPSLQSDNAHVVENNSATPSMTNIPASGANSQLNYVMKPPLAQNMDTGCGPFGQQQKFIRPLNNVFSQQHFAGTSISSRVDTAVLQGISVRASKHPNLKSPGDSVRGSQPSHQILDKNNTAGASNDSVPLANNRHTTVAEWHYRDINTSNSLSPNCQFRTISGSSNNLIPMTQPLMAPHSVPPVTDGIQLSSMECLNPSSQSENAHVHMPPSARPVVEHNSATPSTPNMPASGANSQVNSVTKHQFPQNMNTGSGPSGDLQRLNAPLNNFVSQQHFGVAPTSSPLDPAGMSVGASQQQNLENNPENPGIANSLGSLVDKAKQAGSEPPYHQNEDINVQLRLNDNQIPLTGSGMISFIVPCFVVEIPEDMPFNLWKGAIIEEIKVAVEKVLDNFRNTKLPISGKVTIGKKRATQTVLHDSKEHDILKHKKGKGATENDFSDDGKMNVTAEPHDSTGKMVQGATENDSSHDTKMDIAAETHDSKGIICPDIRKSDDALLDETPTIRSISRNQNAGVVIQKSSPINALTPKVEEQNVDSMHQISDSSLSERRLFSPEELELLVNAAEEHGTGGWRKIKHAAFKDSVKTGNDLKDKWNSLVKKAKTEPAKRRGEHVPDDLLDRVLKIEARYARLRGKPPKPRSLPPNNP